MMIECIQSSLTNGYFRKISNEDEKFIKNGTKSSTLLYKLMMYKAIIDTRAMTYQFRSDLSNLEN